MHGDDLPSRSSGDFLPLAAGDEGLAAADAVQNEFLPAWVQLAQNIIQQQNRVFPAFLQVDFPLRQLQGQGRRPGLALGGKASGQFLVDENVDIILMAAGEALAAVQLRFPVGLLMLT